VGEAGFRHVAIEPTAAIVRADFAREIGPKRARRRALSCGPFHAVLEERMFITPAFAQGGLFGGDSTGMITSFMPLILIVVIMYFLILRPQQQKVKQHQAMIKSLRRGDTVVTNGGLVAKVTKVVDDDHIEIEIADGVRVRHVRAMVSDVRAKGEPVKDDKAA
jgi:preprotein translocase subunit YajC